MLKYGSIVVLSVGFQESKSEMWDIVGSESVAEGVVATCVFDPNNLDHILAVNAMSQNAQRKGIRIQLGMARLKKNIIKPNVANAAKIIVAIRSMNVNVNATLPNPQMVFHTDGEGWIS